ncbi:alpha/beta hydrolase [Rhodoferax koreense]|uniref:Alpha/beta hydrolase n=1 Tax=Rhodoferax koreensis TaxID=1842727 RepID=A0A1P8JTI1_9BURK|nr:alpha/beta hydrolase [Rhodoferax koreense]APW37063.1 alpha/beta hydrolase [Rhodoferax koreense]
MQVKANGISLEVEDTGAPGRPVVLLIMGLGMQLTGWPPALVRALVDAGYRVVRLDNRDIGLSQHFDQLGTPNVLWTATKLRFGLPVRPPYSLRDMALDAVGALDALGIRKAHVVGASMGGMIAQRVALAAPDRVASLTSIMSSSGARHLPPPKPEVLRLMMRRPVDQSRPGLIDHAVRLFQAIGSPGFPTPEAELRARVAESMDRSFHPAGTVRQMVAVGADVTRALELINLRAPTLVLHGRADPLVPYACGEDTARRIQGARLVGIDGMGHDLPPGVVERLLVELQPHLATHT